MLGTDTLGQGLRAAASFSLCSPSLGVLYVNYEQGAWGRLLDTREQVFPHLLGTVSGKTLTLPFVLLLLLLFLSYMYVSLGIYK